MNNLGIKYGLDKSEEYWERAKKVIATGTNTWSRSPMVFPDGASPKFLECEKGSHIWDVNGNEFIDFVGACGPVVVGHCFPEINEAIKKQLDKGILFSLCNPLEVEVAEKLIDIIPCAEQVKFSKNGSDVCNAAIRLARYITDREMVLINGYHGFHDFYIASTDRNFGIPKCVRELTKTFKYNDIESLKSLFYIYKNKIACIIMEPVIAEKPKEGYLQEVKDLCHKNGALLIFDEIISGFRFAIGGAQEYFNVIPDLTTFSKGSANGCSLAILAGPEKYMKHFDKVFMSSTYCTETLALAAASATIDFYKTHPVIETLWKTGEAIESGCKSIIEKYDIGKNVKIVGYPVRLMVLTLDEAGIHNHVLASLYQQEMVKRGNLVFSGVLMLSYSHSEEDIQHFLNSFDETCKIMKEAIESKEIEKYLTCKVGRPVFKNLRELNAVSN